MRKALALVAATTLFLSVAAVPALAVGVSPHPITPPLPCVSVQTVKVTPAAGDIVIVQRATIKFRITNNACAKATWSITTARTIVVAVDGVESPVTMAGYIVGFRGKTSGILAKKASVTVTASIARLPPYSHTGPVQSQDFVVKTNATTRVFTYRFGPKPIVKPTPTPVPSPTPPPVVGCTSPQTVTPLTLPGSVVTVPWRATLSFEIKNNGGAKATWSAKSVATSAGPFVITFKGATSGTIAKGATVNVIATIATPKVDGSTQGYDFVITTGSCEQVFSYRLLAWVVPS